MNTATLPTLRPTTLTDLQAAVTAHARVFPIGARTKPTLAELPAGSDAVQIDLTGLTGIQEYEPGEYTFTAYAGTPLAEIAAALAAHGQYLPFDPPLIDQGATVGGTIAAGLSGSGRYRYGGLRDFILGVQVVDGQGRLVRGGGKVVKNAAGFDLPKLMVGSLGRLGIVASASFKVFPAPLATATLRLHLADLSAGLAALAVCMGGPYDLEALDLVATADGFDLLVRVGGPADVLEARLERLRTRLTTAETRGHTLIADDAALWTEARGLTWAAADRPLVKVATTVHTLPALEEVLAAAGAPRRYCVGGNLAWVSWPGPINDLDPHLAQIGLNGLVLRGQSASPIIGATKPATFLARIQTALDPVQRFLPFA